MFEGQQVLQATFRQKQVEGRKFKSSIASLEFDQNGVYQFVGNEDQYQGVRNLLSFHDVHPDHDPLADASSILDLASLPQGAGKVRPPAENYSDLDDLSDIKQIVAERKANEVPGSNPEGNGQPDLQRASPAAGPAAELQQRSGAAQPDAAGEGVSTGGGNGLRPEAQVDDGDDFSFT